MKNKKGFTLAELLIVVAIIAVLVAIAIPIFTTQLEKSKEATDIANIRSAYAEQVTNILDDTNTFEPIHVTAKQSKDKWQSNGDADDIYIANGIDKYGLMVECSTNGWNVDVDTSGNDPVIVIEAE